MSTEAESVARCSQTNTYEPANVQRWRAALESEVEPWELAELDNPRSLVSAFSGSLAFGTGGIRHPMGIGPNRINRLTIGMVTQGFANWLYDKPGAKSVVICYDTRTHSHAFAEITACVLASNGIRSLLLPKAQPTPVLDFSVRNLGCSAGICITASHNSREYNGFKVYGADGVQITDATARAIQAQIELVNPFDDVRPMGMAEAIEAGLVAEVSADILDLYHEAVLTQRLDVNCADLHVVYSPLNGTGLNHAERIMNALGINYSLVDAQVDPDGSFSNCPKPNPENPAAMAAGMKQMAEEGADLFLANDPDADRIGVACLHQGLPRLLAGDEIGLLLFDYICRHSTESRGSYAAVTTIVTTPLADSIAEAHGVELIRTLTGFKYIGEQIGWLKNKGKEFLLGFEESCGYLRGDYVRDKDGMCALMLICEVAAYYKSQSMTLADALRELYERYGFILGRQLTTKFDISGGKAPAKRLVEGLRSAPPASLSGLTVERTIDYLHEQSMPTTAGVSSQELPPSDVLEWQLAGGTRVLIRPSGTEPILKIYIFAHAPTKSRASELLESLYADINALIDTRKNRIQGGTVIHVVLLSGGSGTRLWPLSNAARSKQFLKVLRDAAGNSVSMVQRVFTQIAAVDADIDITIATSASQVDTLAMQVGGRYALSVEPSRRDTAPAIMLACAHLSLIQGASPEDPVVVMPIDTYADQAYYDCIPLVAETVVAGTTELVLLGVEPTYPSEKYGYIIPSETESTPWPVNTFREKPDKATAITYIAQGGLWNCGVFGFRLGWLRELTNSYVDAKTFDELVERYHELPKNSFDYEVVELAQSICVVPYSGSWKDLGTWNTLTDEMAEEASGPVWLDEPSVSNVHVINETNLPMVVAGISDAAIVATPDGILVTGKRSSAHIKNLVEEASLSRPMYERKPWGEYRVLDSHEHADKDHAITRELIVLPRHQLSYQRHSHRSEVWTITSGTGEAVLDGDVTLVKTGDVLYIGPKQLHAVRATTELHIIEVQVGRPLDEEDVERFGVFWNEGAFA